MLHSADDGAHWEAQRTGQPLPLDGVFFADELHGWAVGELGSILATADGGRSWKLQRRSGLRTAALFVHARAAGTPLDTVALLGGQEGYLTASVARDGRRPGQRGVDPLHRRRPAERGGASGRRGRLRNAVAVPRRLAPGPRQPRRPAPGLERAAQRPRGGTVTAADGAGPARVAAGRGRHRRPGGRRRRRPGRRGHARSLQGRRRSEVLPRTTVRIGPGTVEGVQAVRPLRRPGRRTSDHRPDGAERRAGATLREFASAAAAALGDEKISLPTERMLSPFGRRRGRGRPPRLDAGRRVGPRRPGPPADRRDGGAARRGQGGAPAGGAAGPGRDAHRRSGRPGQAGQPHRADVARHARRAGRPGRLRRRQPLRRHRPVGSGARRSC